MRSGGTETLGAVSPGEGDLAVLGVSCGTKCTGWEEVTEPLSGPPERR